MRTPLLVAALLASVASCGTETDDRPPTADYLTAAIFRPACGTAACHSSATGRSGRVLDTVAGVCDANGRLPLALTVAKDSDKRMPLDSPLPDADIALIFHWNYVDGDPEGIPLDPPAGCEP